jgi:hypothetical protein
MADMNDFEEPDTLTRGQRYPLGQRIPPVTPNGALIARAIIEVINARVAEHEAKAAAALAEQQEPR